LAADRLSLPAPQEFRFLSSLKAGVSTEGTAMNLDGARRAVWLAGLDTDHIRSVVVRDSHLTAVTDPTNMIAFADNLTFADFTVNGAPAVT